MAFFPCRSRRKLRRWAEKLRIKSLRTQWRSSRRKVVLLCTPNLNLNHKYNYQEFRTNVITLLPCQCFGFGCQTLLSQTVFPIRGIRLFMSLPYPVRNYLYGSGSFHQQAKKIALITTLFWLLNNLLSWNSDVNIPTYSKYPGTVISKTNLGEKNFFVGILKATEEKSRILFLSRITDPAPDPYK